MYFYFVSSTKWRYYFLESSYKDKDKLHATLAIQFSKSTGNYNTRQKENCPPLRESIRKSHREWNRLSKHFRGITDNSNLYEQTFVLTQVSIYLSNLFRTNSDKTNFYQTTKNMNFSISQIELKKTRFFIILYSQFFPSKIYDI